jgi:hypothetical protein
MVENTTGWWRVAGIMGMEWCWSILRVIPLEDYPMRTVSFAVSERQAPTCAPWRTHHRIARSRDSDRQMDMPILMSGLSAGR